MACYNLHSLTYNDKDNGIHAHFGLTDYYKDGFTSPDTSVNPEKNFDGPGKKMSYPSRSWNFDLNKRWILGAIPCCLADPIQKISSQKP